MASEVLFNVSMKNMNLQELMTRIQLPEEAQQEVFEYLLNESDYLNWKEIFYKDAQGFWEKWKMTENHFQWILSFYLQLVCEVYEEYQKQKINDQIFKDTFFDITIWAKECKRKYGFYGLEEVEWISVSVRMKLFRLGRLQFEPIILEEDFTGKKFRFEKGRRIFWKNI